MVTSTDIVSSLLLVTSGSTDVTDFVVVALTVDGDTFPISASAKVL